MNEKIAVLRDQIVAGLNRLFDHEAHRLPKKCVQDIYDELYWQTIQILFVWKMTHDNVMFVSFFEELFNGESLVDWRKKIFNIVSFDVYTIVMSEMQYLRFFLPMTKSFRK